MAVDAKPGYTEVNDRVMRWAEQACDTDGVIFLAVAMHDGVPYTGMLDPRRVAPGNDERNNALLAKAQRTFAEAAGEREPDAKRVYSDAVRVPLVEKADAALSRLCAGLDLNRTDVVNRAVQVYDFVEAERLEGRTLWIKDGDTFREVEFNGR